MASAPKNNLAEQMEIFKKNRMKNMLKRKRLSDPKMDTKRTVSSTDIRTTSKLSSSSSDCSKSNVFQASKLICVPTASPGNSITSKGASKSCSDITIVLDDDNDFEDSPLSSTLDQSNSSSRSENNVSSSNITSRVDIPLDNDSNPTKFNDCKTIISPNKTARIEIISSEVVDVIAPDISTPAPISPTKVVTSSPSVNKRIYSVTPCSSPDKRSKTTDKPVFVKVQPSKTKSVKTNSSSSLTVSDPKYSPLKGG